MNKFYMIYVEGENAPTVAHMTMTSALAGAKRLAKQTGKNVFILEAVKSVHFHEFDIEDLVPAVIPEHNFEVEMPFNFKNTSP